MAKTKVFFVVCLKFIRLKIFDVPILENFSLAFYDIIDVTPGSNGDLSDPILMM